MLVLDEAPPLAETDETLAPQEAARVPDNVLIDFNRRASQLMRPQDRSRPDEASVLQMIEEARTIQASLPALVDILKQVPQWEFTQWCSEMERTNGFASMA